MANKKFNEVFYKTEVIRDREIYKEKDNTPFKGKLYCPECKEAKIFILGTKKNKSLSDNSTSIHADYCSYNHNNVNKKQAKILFNETEKFKIDKGLKDVYKARYEENKNIGNIVVKMADKNNKFNRYAMQLNHVEDIDSTLCNTPEVFFGTALSEVKKTNRGYTIILTAVKSGFQYFAINVSEVAYSHFPKSVKNSLEKSLIPVNFIYYGILIEDKKGWKTSTLKNTNCFVVGRDNKTN